MHLARYVRSRREVFPAAIFIFERDMRPLNRIRGRQFGIMLIRTLFVVSLVAAFAGPEVGVGAEESVDSRGGRVLFVIDSSLSMEEADGSGRLLDAAREYVTRRLGELGEGAHAGVVLCPPAGAIRVDWVGGEELAGLAELIPAGGSSGGCSPASLLSRLLPFMEGVTSVEMVSDFRVSRGELTELEELARREPRVRLARLSTQSANMVLRELRGTSSLLALVQNQGEGPAEAALVARCGENDKRVYETIGGWGSRWIGVDLPDTTLTGSCSLRVEDSTFRYDNELHFTVSPRSAPSVLVVDGSGGAGGTRPPSSYVTAALRASGAVDVVSIGQAEFTADLLDSSDVVFWVDPLPLGEQLEAMLGAFLDKGGSMVVFAGENMASWPEQSLLFSHLKARVVKAGPERAATLVPEADGPLEWSSSSALTKTWSFNQHMALAFLDDGQQVAARFSDEAPAVVVAGRGGGTLATVGFLPSAGNGSAVWHPLFPMLVGSLLKLHSGDEPEIRFPTMCQMGSPCDIGLSGTMSRAFVGGESGKSVVTMSAHGEVVCQEAGPYWESGGERSRVLFQCRPPEAEIPGVQWELRATGSGGGETGGPAMASRYQVAPAALFAALLLLVGEMLLVAGRHLRLD